GGICEADSCAYSSFAGGGAAERLSFMAEPGTTFYVVVDGYEGASGAYSLEATCADAEICDNDTDDNGNGLIDCEDSQCRADAACAEACGNAEDDDADALVDCADPDCGDDPACFESACGDSTDNDGDGSTDCADFECVGATECAGGTGVVGDPCAAHTDCVAGACFDERSIGWAGGYCLVYSPTTDCTSLSCPAGSRCVAFGPAGPWACLDGCTATADCRPGHACRDSDGDRVPDVCVGGCTDSAQCTATAHCTGSPATPGSCRMPPEVCDNSADDDGDTLADCADTDCAFHAACGTTPVALAGGNTCAVAVPIPLPAGERGATAVTGTLATANGDNRDPSCASRDSADVAYSFTLTRAASVVADLRGGPAAPALTDSVLSISRACTEPDFQCSDDFGGLLYNSRVQGRLGPGAYYLFVDGYNGSTGTYTLGLLLSEP
ncbi:MAG: hypothetical protein QME96_10415, partial [Myxococcota bacterium]|nr:hypothetical protein [Myxococcota bacterium]